MSKPKITVDMLRTVLDRYALTIHKIENTKANLGRSANWLVAEGLNRELAEITRASVRAMLDNDADKVA